MIPAYVNVLEIKRDTATYWMERDNVNMYTYNRAHLLDSVDIYIGPNMVDFLVTIVSSEIPVISLKSELYEQVI